ncbi:hypothetical protein [Dehalobacter sp. TeCB1]|uniref:hypothetical protein n=1 Tax=Dehalobacter sp. TeCB1 TaxID=1843715 RepID=UPI00083A77CD|nr:hypothetical protein [Dehalobacter sp. TeCB1]OCZ49731.1 hypothetical protein A7D23_02565 [Dehalobacter sp. TeCB1]
MPTITVTEELINTIKSERKLRKFKSTELSSKLKKNTSFISMLENGRVKELDLEVFYLIFETLIPDKTSRSEFVNELINTLSVKLTESEIKKQVWMKTFDLQYRLIVIPDNIIKFLLEKIDSYKEKNITTKTIIDKINSNEGVPQSENLKENRVYINHGKNGNFRFKIKFKLEDDYLDQIINRNTEKINYITLLGIINAIYLIDGYSIEEAYTLANEFLYKNKFYNLIERYSIFEQNDENLLSDQDKKFLGLREGLIQQINFLSDKDVGYINQRIEILLNNLDKVPVLTLAILGINLSDLKVIDREKQREFLLEYKDLIVKYKNIENTLILERLD